MDNQPSFDRGILLPIGVGVFSLIGLCVILFAGRITASRATVEEVPTATSFHYELIGTEPAITTVTLEATNEVTIEVPDEGEFMTLTPSFGTSPARSTPIVLPTLTGGAPLFMTLTPTGNVTPPTRTPTSASTAPFGAGTFDDIDSRFVYNGNWQITTGSSYQNTLHVSGTLGNSVAFRYIGQELRVFFQAAPSLGTIRLTLDGTGYDMSEANSSTQNYEWVLPSATVGTHSVTISHLSGGSVNLNYIIVPEIPTTPTATSTP